jgi:hypothetical protein
LGKKINNLATLILKTVTLCVQYAGWPVLKKIELRRSSKVELRFTLDERRSEPRFFITGGWLHPKRTKFTPGGQLKPCGQSSPPGAKFKTVRKIAGKKNIFFSLLSILPFQC